MASWSRSVVTGIFFCPCSRGECKILNVTVSFQGWKRAAKVVCVKEAPVDPEVGRVLRRCTVHSWRRSWSTLISLSHTQRRESGISFYEVVPVFWLSELILFFFWRQCFSLLVEHSHVTKIVLLSILEKFPAVENYRIPPCINTEILRRTAFYWELCFSACDGVCVRVWACARLFCARLTPLWFQQSHNHTSICHLPRNTEPSCYRVTSVTSSGDLLLVKHNVDWKCVDTCREHMRSKACMETQKRELHTLPFGKISVKAKNKQKKRALGISEAPREHTVRVALSCTLHKSSLLCAL